MWGHRTNPPNPGLVNHEYFMETSRFAGALHVTPDTCHVSGDICQVSGIRCQIFLFVDKVVLLVAGGSVINMAYPV